MVNRVFHRIEWVDVRDLLSYDILEGNREVIGILQKNGHGDRP